VKEEVKNTKSQVGVELQVVIENENIKGTIEQQETQDVE